jgi:hypothetical protein
LKNRARMKNRFLGVINSAIHQDGAHFREFGTLKRFGKDVGPHLVGRAVFECKFSRFVIMTDVEVFSLDVFSAFGAGNIAILGQRESTHVVLIDNVGSNGVTLCLKKMTGPQDVARFVMKANDFAFSRTLGRYLLFVRGTCCCTVTKSEERSRVSLAVIMGMVRSIDIPFDIGERVGRKG